jgi:N utilization substance protein A
LPGEEESTNPRLADIEGLPPATIAVLEHAGYKTLDDVIDLEREDFLKLAGIAPEEADRLIAIIDELTTDADDAAPELAPSSGTPASGEEPSA